MREKRGNLPNKSQRIDLLKLTNYLNGLDLSNDDDLNFWIYCSIATRSGLRSIDILKMKVNNINFQDRVAHIIEKKTKRKVSVPIHSEVLQKIDKSQEYVIWNKKYSSNVSLMTINRRLKKIFKDEDVNVSSHSIRKSVGRRIYEVTQKDLVKAMKFLGHKTPSTTITYLEIDKEELNELYSMLDASL